MKLVPLLSLALFCTACAREAEPCPTCGDAGAPACSANFSGNFSDHGTAEACTTLSAQQGGSRLQVTAHSDVLGADLRFTADLATALSPGTYTAATLASWSAVIVSASGCEISGGSQAVPSGDVTLELSDVQASSVHGRAALSLRVHAPDGIDCGAGDAEDVELEF